MIKRHSQHPPAFRIAGALVLLGVLALFGAPGCSGVDDGARMEASCPSGAPEDFELVSAVLEARCGTLDCHGSFYRPLRIYGQTGLRRPESPDEGSGIDFAGYYPGGTVPTTNAELKDNLRSICGLEPELMTAVVAGEASPEELLLVKKARLRERHKGGRLWDKGSDGDRCVTSWLTGVDGKSKCEAELLHP